MKLPRLSRRLQRLESRFGAGGVDAGEELTREYPLIAADTHLSSERVIAVLERLAGTRGVPSALVCDNGPEFTSRAFDAWAYRRGIKLLFIRPGKPVENAFIESFNGRLRDECLSLHWFLDLADARGQLEQWRCDYIGARPHSGLERCIPNNFARDFARATTSTDPQPLYLKRGEGHSGCSSNRRSVGSMCHALLNEGLFRSKQHDFQV